MADAYTFTDFAQLLCQIDGREGDAHTEAVALQLRGAHHRGHIGALGYRGARGALLIGGTHEACVARLALVLIDLGIHGDALKNALAFMRAEREITLTDGKSRRRSIYDAVDGVISGESWYLVIVTGRIDGEIAYNLQFATKHELSDKIHKNGASDYPILACSVLPVTDLLKPLLDELHA